MMVISSTDKDNSVLFLAKRSPPVGILFSAGGPARIIRGDRFRGEEIAAIRNETHRLRLSKVSDTFKK